MKKFVIVLPLLFVLTLVSSFARQSVYHRWSVRLQSGMDHTRRTFLVSATTLSMAVAKARYLAKTTWQPQNNQGYRVVLVQDLGRNRR
jgi:hypothetical protein